MLEDVLYEGMEAEFAELQGNCTSSQSEEDVNSCQKKSYIKQYNELVKLVPTFSSIISEFEKAPSAMDNFIHALSSAANDARSDDTGSLTREGLTYMLKNPESDQFNPSLLKHHGKIARGWNHPQTARLLCPMRMLSTFDADSQSFMEKVKEGQIKITAAKLPTFLYDESMFDPAKKVKVVFGDTISNVFRHIFTGPSSALNPNARRGTKIPKGRIHGMTSPLPRAIAYAAVQAYFQLSSSNIWCQEIEDLDLVDLYDRVVDMFEGNTNRNGWKKCSSIGNHNEAPGLQQRRHTRAKTDAGSRVDDDDSEDDMDGFFDSEEHSPDAGNGSNDGSTGDGVPTRTDSNIDDMNERIIGRAASEEDCDFRINVPSAGTTGRIS
ncbi:hypothetical protein EDB19DRAFT_1831488 [Suillus lakei]|nr:hypothetical protein EDB19DRAFT_1831488 [Suillus lakei]